MGTRRNGRERILAAAQGLFHERGVAATSIDDIAAAADVSKATVYHHFGSKDDLVRTIVEALCGFYEARVIPALTKPRGLAAVEETMRFTERYLREQRGDLGCPIGALALEHADRPGPVRDRLADTLRTWQDALAETMERSAGEGRLPDHVDPAHLAALVLAAYQGATLVGRVTKDVSFVEDASAALRQLIGGAGGPPSVEAPVEDVPRVEDVDPLDQPWIV